MEINIKNAKKTYIWAISVILTLIISIYVYSQIKGDGFIHLIFILSFIYLPLGIFQYYQFIIQNTGKDRKKFKNIQHSKIKYKEIYALICTNGKASDVVNEKIIPKLKGYSNLQKMIVVKEEYDTFNYSAYEIVVPKEYKTKNNSKMKKRALQYAIEYLFKNKLINKNTYLLHLDDDSIVGKDYIDAIHYMNEDAGQGYIRLREWKHHLFNTLADLIRVSDCHTLCSYYNKHNTPHNVHGEGLVIKAEVEYKIGWDTGTNGADDFLMGQMLHEQGYTFEYIPFAIYIAPPTSFRDFYKQRKRWYRGIWGNFNKFRNWKLKIWLIFRNINCILGIIGIVLIIFGIIIRIPIPFSLELISVFNLLSYTLAYQYGAFKTDIALMPFVLLFQIPVSFYEQTAIIYSLFSDTNQKVFDSVKKV